MLFSIPERVLLLNILAPAQGEILLLRAVRELREALSFSEDEHSEFSITQQGGVVNWSNGRDKEIAIGPQVRTYVAQCLRDASTKGVLQEGLLRVWDEVVRDEP